ncbi:MULTISPECIES: TetR/AcrR family transcriptional regulator [unclassified Salinibacterium]|uniref:TetR/AcrR family transcriptional regulator n=1 Tax=unclassified Salinibacterium TaxID=2632331 RepID=UPI0018CE715D|nr:MULTISPECIES: TetR/AcrR family transcriptional regulator [unclassified Salinibacterium]MBH0055004.1 TetR/AcrR family transcriptional regulator [Salinibacterium sp. SWN139]MBH0083854.1 TetR/AcrR family transcriptional regulator [Salinibacterium sp. SWN167]MBH0117268.1 TetR/AcrR family transcriptional regulator [Salinibacterium sp. NG253]
MVSTEMPRDQLRGRETKQRVIEAAAAEFAEYGVAGARINRIAETAKASKERIYAWFGDKDALFDHVMQTGLDRLAHAVPIDADLVEYTVRLHNYFVNDQSAQRVTMWAWLHDAETLGSFSEGRVEGYKHKLEVIADAQQRGIVDSSWKPEELLALLLAVASNWERAPAELRSIGCPEFAGSEKARCDSVREAARRLVEPHS